MLGCHRGARHTVAADANPAGSGLATRLLGSETCLQRRRFKASWTLLITPYCLPGIPECIAASSVYTVVYVKILDDKNIPFIMKDISINE